jgi:colanic acid biosynthesis glycosyl transferase WcaI
MNSLPSGGFSSSATGVPSIYVLYHYLPPDDVVSAVHLGDLCAGLSQRGWDVSAFPCVRGCRDEFQRFPSREIWQGVKMHRRWRPGFRQSSAMGRLLNAAFMICSWSLLALGRKTPDVVLIGTDPILGLVSGLAWKLFKPKSKIVHWCFDVYPEAAIADGLLRQDSRLVSLFRCLMRPAYKACSLIVDIGPCMRNLLQRYPTAAWRETLVPWALDEPDAVLAVDSEERDRVFPPTRLAMLYSGSFGRAHSYEELLKLAEILVAAEIRVVFSVRGNRYDELRAAAEFMGDNIHFVSFAAANRLRERLSCADIHLVSLRPDWTGTVVPSKFFGALAAGRPVLFSGSKESSLARWIEQYQVGWVLDSANIESTAVEILAYASNPDALAAMNQRCFNTYRDNFSKSVQIELWDTKLRDMLSAGEPHQEAKQ